jgi:hypothetical protein
MSQLPTPPPGNPAPPVLIAGWNADGQLECTVQTGALEDPADWGYIFALMALHIAQGVQQRSGQPVEQTLQVIHQRFTAQLQARPGGEPS